jgi:Mannosyl-glycoprotein endo-beta-N-acetylglucosaminidase
VPASVTIAQAILESGWGRSGLSRDGNNYFGMKMFRGPGHHRCRLPPILDERVHPQLVLRDERALPRLHQRVELVCRPRTQQLSTLDRDRTALRYVNAPDRYATEIDRASYATSPTYVQNLINLMRQHTLYRFDWPWVAGWPPPCTSCLEWGSC